VTAPKPHRDARSSSDMDLDGSLAIAPAAPVRFHALPPALAAVDVDLDVGVGVDLDCNGDVDCDDLL
jgi:hypothetical protein